MKKSIAKNTIINLYDVTKNNATETADKTALILAAFSSTCLNDIGQTSLKT